MIHKKDIKGGSEKVSGRNKHISAGPQRQYIESSKDKRAYSKKGKTSAALGPFTMERKETRLQKLFDSNRDAIGSVSFDWNDDSRGYGLVSVIRDGIDYQTFQVIIDKTPFNVNEWATLLDTTTRTLVRYKKDNKKFASKQTETIIEIQQLMKYGEEVFGNLNNFHTWLTTENVAMGGVVPKDLLDTSVGLGMVKDFLGRIEHGILA